MFIKSLLPVAGLAALAHATSTWDITEEVGTGNTFYHRGPKTARTATEYESTFCHTAIAKMGATASSDASCLTELRALKASKTPEELLSLLSADIKAADSTWHAVISNSTGTSHVSANAEILVVVPGINMLSFAAYYLSAYAQASYQKINAEHYINRDTASPAGAQEILEGWGGVTTHFSLAPTDRAQFDYLPALDEFPIKTASDKILRDGTDAKFGVVDIALRDVVGPELDMPAGTKGVHVKSSVWYGNGAPADFVEVEAQHVIVEIVNHALNARVGYESGEIVLEELVAGLCVLFPTMSGCSS